MYVCAYVRADFLLCVDQLLTVFLYYVVSKYRSFETLTFALFVHLWCLQSFRKDDVITIISCLWLPNELSTVTIELCCIELNCIVCFVCKDDIRCDTRARSPPPPPPKKKKKKTGKKKEKEMMSLQCTLLDTHSGSR